MDHALALKSRTWWVEGIENGAVSAASFVFYWLRTAP